MAVNDHRAVIAQIAEKSFADPAHLGRILFGNRDPGTNTGMHEDIIAALVNILKPAQEGNVLGRNVDAEQVDQRCEIGFVIVVWVDPVADKGFSSADPVEQPD